LQTFTEQKKDNASDSFLMVNLNKGEVHIEEISSIHEDKPALEQISILSVEPAINEIPKKSPPTFFLFQKKYLQLLLISSGVLSGLILAYDLKHHQTLETRDVIAGINGLISIAGLSYFSNYQQKKEKVDDEKQLKL
jgi:hypothetical protein